MSQKSFTVGTITSRFTLTKKQPQHEQSVSVSSGEAFRDSSECRLSLLRGVHRQKRGMNLRLDLENCCSPSNANLYPIISHRIALVLQLPSVLPSPPVQSDAISAAQREAEYTRTSCN